ncbi:MAG: hypothetical protein U9Q06_03250 [Nanoarchaeota archaeon]|nr:hypothetical protein [Nanoarchaeota archaeon]
MNEEKILLSVRRIFLRILEIYNFDYDFQMLFFVYYNASGTKWSEVKLCVSEGYERAEGELVKAERSDESFIVRSEATSKRANEMSKIGLCEPEGRAVGL